MIKKIALPLICGLVAVMMLSDIFHASALRQWRDQHAERGARMLRFAALLNPLAMGPRLDELDSLYAGYRQTRNPLYLREAVLISHSITRDYPGSFQGAAVYSSALTLALTHGVGNVHYPLNEALDAISRDPISVTTIERAMFLLAVMRRDYGTFKALGIQRARLTRDGLNMTCDLCGRPWMEHKAP